MHQFMLIVLKKECKIYYIKIIFNLLQEMLHIQKNNITLEFAFDLVFRSFVF